MYIKRLTILPAFGLGFAAVAEAELSFSSKNRLI